MKLLITFPPEAKEDLEKALEIEKQNFWTLGRGATKRLDAILRKKQLGLSFDWEFISDHEVMLTIRTATYIYDTFILKKFKSYEKAYKFLTVKEVVA